MWSLVQPRRLPGREEGNLPRLRRALLAASEVPHWHARLLRAGLGTPERIGSLGSVAEALRRLPLSAAGGPPHFAGGRPRLWRRLLSDTLSGSVEGLLSAPPPRRARRVVVWSQPGAPPLSDGNRDRLWNAFGLPVFEEIRGYDGELLGFECEAHDGLHLGEHCVVAECIQGELVLTSLAAVRCPLLRVRTGWRGLLERGACECGKTALLWREEERGAWTPDISYDILKDASR